MREAGGAPRRHLVTSPQECPNTLINVVIDRTVRLHARTAGEVVRPAHQNAVELIPDFRPRSRVLRAQQVSHFLPQPAHALLGRTRTLIPKPLPRAMRPKCISEKVKPLLPGLPDAGLRLVQREPDALHHRSRPTQRFCRASAAENHEVIGIGNDSGMESFTPSGDPPILQESVHIKVGQQWADHPTLGRAPSVLLSPAHTSFPLFI